MTDTGISNSGPCRGTRARGAPAMAGLLVLLAAPALAQQAVIDRCRATSSDADRIACLEAAILGREAAAAQPPAPAATAVKPPGPMPAEPEPTAEPEPKPLPAGREAEPGAGAPSGIGAEQVIARRQTADERREQLEEARGVAVAAYDYVPYRRLVVTLENGQVWRQIKGDNQYLRVDLRRNQTADITESSLGGYKLRLNEMRRTIRVERVR